jgi:hypothetical protein
VIDVTGSFVEETDDYFIILTPCNHIYFITKRRF